MISFKNEINRRAEKQSWNKLVKNVDHNTRGQIYNCVWMTVLETNLIYLVYHTIANKLYDKEFKT